MYDRSDAGRNLRRYMGVSLAWWHSFKWATKRIVVVFACDFIAPMFHSLFPTKELSPMKISHTSACTLLSYIRLAYPSFRGALEAALANPVLLPRQLAILRNLSYLCEFFIPVVCLGGEELVPRIFLFFFCSTSLLYTTVVLTGVEVVTL